jgi:hypothetical protein
MDAAIASQKVMARTIVVMLNKFCEVAGVSRFDKHEEESLMLGAGAMLYEEGAQLSGRTLFGLALGGVTLPRLAEKAEQLRKQKKEKQLLVAATPSPIIVAPPPLVAVPNG